MSNIKLEIGKKYIIKDTSLSAWVEAATFYMNMHMWCRADDGGYLLYTREGKFWNAASSSGWDIVGEYQDNNPYPLTENPSFAKEVKASYVGTHKCVAVDTGFRKTWCKICEQDMEY